MNQLFTPEERKVQKDVLFWARRLAYDSVDSHPEWRERYIEAKAKLVAIRAEKQNKVCK